MNKFIKTIILFLIFGMVFIYSYFIEPGRLVINSQTLVLPNWSETLNGLKIAVVSDLHIGTGKVSLERLNKIVDNVNSQSPDLVIIPGDFDAMSIKYSKILPKKISEVLAKLQAPYGVVAVLGNHDYIPENVVKPILNDAGIILLENKSTEIFYNNQKVRICGTKDLWHYNLDIKDILGEVNSPTILVTHNPDIFPEVPSSVALTLSGHTHGGELALPILGALFVPSKYSQRYVKGHVVENNKHLFVTSGIASLSRFRTFNPPEIVILKLYAKKDSKIVNSIPKIGLSDLAVGFHKRKFG